MRNEKLPEKKQAEEQLQQTPETPVSPEAQAASVAKNAAQEQPPETFQSRLPSSKRTALLRYMAVMFAAAFVLVLASFVMQMRSSNTTISELSESSVNALAKAEKLQEENRALQQRLLQAQSETAAAYEAGEGKVKDTKIAYDALIKVLITEPKEGDVAYASAVETVRKMQGSLTEEAVAIFEGTLKAREEAAAAERQPESVSEADATGNEEQ